MSVNKTLVDRIVELVDGDSWVLADLLVEEFPEDKYGGLGGKGKLTGLHAELEEYEKVLRVERGIELKMGYMAAMRLTAIAWPNSARAPLVPFGVHLRVRGPNREREMKKLMRMAAREGRTLSITMVGRFRVDEKGSKPLKPLDERLRPALESTLKRFLLYPRINTRADWWTDKTISMDTRRVAADVLRFLAADLEADE